MTDTKATSIVTALPVVVKPIGLDPAWHADFNFYQGRWTKPEGLIQAKSTLKFLIKQGHDASLHMGLVDTWDKCAKVTLPYYRVYIRNPKAAGYYTWFAPASEKVWSDPLDFSVTTWFEFLEPKT